MQHNIYDRFHGCWWGGILASRCFPSTTDKKPKMLEPSWLKKRRALARILIEHKLRTASSAVVSSLSLVRGTATPDYLSVSDEVMLVWLPLIMFGTDNGIGQPEFISDGFNLFEGIEDEENEQLQKHLSIWSQLVNGVLYSRLSRPLGRIVTDRLSNEQQFNSLVSKLRLVQQRIEGGITLQQLEHQLKSSNNLREQAVALSWYCFATTPRNFELSVKRAIRVEPRVALLTATLTGTLSGAYNGMTRISGYGRSLFIREGERDLENYLFDELFADWLGVYAAGAARSCDLTLEAIAPPKLMQTRSGLKIISQSNFHN